MDNDLIYKIGLSMIPNIGPVLGKNLVANCGSAEEVFRTSKAALSKIPGIGLNKADDIINANVFARAEQEIKFIEKNNIQALYYLDPEYPSRFKHFDYSPIMVYYKGDSSKLNALKTVAIVGTRKPTERGKIFTEKFVADLVDSNVVIVSGLAYGIDIIAHKASLKNNIATIGIMGNGQDVIYPSEHRETAKKMENDGGGLLTEFPSGTKPDRANFPMRNRLIAALSDAVIVVESNKSGGSIITAEFAVEYNKDVFAVPGRLDDERSKGCNALIKSNKAHMIESAEDLFYIMRWSEPKKNIGIQTSLFLELTESEEKIIDFTRSKKEVSIDELIVGLQLSTSTLAGDLLSLEFRGIIKSLPGKKYMLI
jgi:DNA processing protein